DPANRCGIRGCGARADWEFHHFPARGDSMTGKNLGTRREALGWLAGGGIVATALLAVNRTRGADDEVDRAKVPKAVMEAANRLGGEARWGWGGKGVEGDKKAFELDGKDAQGRDVTVLVTADGKAVECETELKDPPRDVPKKVLAAIQKEWKNFIKPTEAQEIRQGKNLRRGDDGDYVYDVRGKVGDKEREIQVQVSAGGEILESTPAIPLT